jgi:hypothetical protein
MCDSDLDRIPHALNAKETEDVDRKQHAAGADRWAGVREQSGQNRDQLSRPPINDLAEFGVERVLSWVEREVGAAGLQGMRGDAEEAGSSKAAHHHSGRRNGHG